MAVSSLVLIVDDHPDNRFVYRSLLVHRGYQVIEAGNGREAITVATERHPDAILMDMSLPGIDGWEATRVLKANPDTRDIPILALTAHVSEEHRRKAEDAGCDGYITKPVLPAVVANEVERLISGRRLTTS
jgi:two-component system cell cycle response regulator DivK